MPKVNSLQWLFPNLHWWGRNRYFFSFNVWYDISCNLVQLNLPFTQNTGPSLSPEVDSWWQVSKWITAAIIKENPRKDGSPWITAPTLITKVNVGEGWRDQAQAYFDKEVGVIVLRIPSLACGGHLPSVAPRAEKNLLGPGSWTSKPQTGTLRRR